MLSPNSDGTENGSRGDIATRFKPGTVANPAGRPKGSKNRLKEKFLDCLANDFDAHGISAIEQCRAENPAAYLKVVASLIPQDVNVMHKTVFDEMDAHELARLVAILSAESARLVDGNASSHGAEEAGSLQSISEAEVIS